MAPKLWNSLPLNLRAVDTVDVFKNKIKTHLFILSLLLPKITLYSLLDCLGGGGQMKTPMILEVGRISP
ncbi:hypothetical protein LDENG_00105070 [Lucifuga dentata]|nr:hypothetical protein LDENG_00105070 [Lucifuga dentata]